MLKLHWPQITYLIMYMFTLFYIAAMNGREYSGKYNFALHFMLAIFYGWLLYCGGFFS